MPQWNKGGMFFGVAFRMVKKSPERDRRTVSGSVSRLLKTEKNRKGKENDKGKENGY